MYPFWTHKCKEKKKIISLLVLKSFSSSATLVNVASSYLVSGKVPGRMGTAHSSIVPYESFCTRNGEYLIAGALNDGQFSRLCSALQIPGDDPRFASNELRVKHRKELINILKERFLLRDKKEWLDLLEHHRVPCGPINNLKQVFEDPQVQARGMRQSVNHSSAGNIDLVSPPVRFDGHQSKIRSAPPELGQHTWEVLHDELGMSNIEYERLVKDKAIGKH